MSNFYANYPVEGGGGRSGVTTIGTLDGKPKNANGATIDGTSLFLQTADATYPGLLSTGAQIIAGNKTFLGSISASNLSGTNTGDVTIGTANGLSIVGQALSLALSSTSTTGALSSTDWNIFNSKFNLPALTSGSVLFSNGTTISQDNSNFFWDNTNKRLGIGTTTPSNAIHARKSSSGVGVNILAENTSATANSDAHVRVITAAGGGNPHFIASVDSTNYWAFGLDQADSNSFKIAPTANLATSTALAITTAGVVKIPNLTGSRAVVTDGNSNLTSSFTTAIEIDFLSGVTSNVQAQLNAKGSGTVTSFSFFSANGFNGVVTNATTTPNLLISVPVTGILESNGASLSAKATTGANSIVLRDANQNISINNSVTGYTSTVTSAGTTTLTVSSTYQQFFTGTTTQTITLPVVSTLTLGHSYFIINQSSGSLTVNSSGGNLVQTIAPLSRLLVTCILTSGTTDTSWKAMYTPTLTSGSVVFSDGTNLSQDNSNFFWDNSAKRLTIGGPPTPLATLHTYGGNLLVDRPTSNPTILINKGDAAVTNTYFGFSNTGSTNTNRLSIFTNNAATLTGGSEKMVILNTGNVGIGISSPDTSSLLDITSTTKGFLMPRMTTAQRDAISTPATGLQVYNTTTNALNYYNGSAWTVVGVVPTVQRFTSGSGTYTTPAGVRYITVEMVGGGGGGGGSTPSTGTAGIGGAGGNSTFGTSLLTANGGSGGGQPNNGGGGAGGSATVNSPATNVIASTGGYGFTSVYVSSTSAIAVPAGQGASTQFGAGGLGPIGAVTAGGAANANTGAGGGGGGCAQTTAQNSGCGGGGGGYIKALITSPSATYSYAVGAGGTAGTAGTSGAAGGAGGSGIIIVTEYYV